MFGVKTPDFISNLSWPILHQKTVFKLHGPIPHDLFWLHLESFKLNNYGGQIDKIESEAEEEGDIASLEPQTSKVVKILMSFTPGKHMHQFPTDPSVRADES